MNKQNKINHSVAGVGKVVIAAVALLTLAGCASLVKPNEQKNIAVPVGPAPTAAVTQIDGAMQCLAQHYPRNVDLRLAVNDLTDGTGTTMSQNSFSKVLTQRPDYMMTIGLAKTGVRLVNRSSTGVSEWEIRQSMQKYIGDEKSFVDPALKKAMNYRPVKAGALLGSTHYVSGAFTELNWNIFSDVNELGIAGLNFGGRGYRISMAVDLIVTDTLSTEIVMARSYTKQLVGYEYSAGMFRFFDVGTSGKNLGPNEVFQFNIGKQANEPVHTAVRWMLETAAYEIVSELSNVGSACDDLLPQESRPKRKVANGDALKVENSQPVNGQLAASHKNAVKGVNIIDDENQLVVRVDMKYPVDQQPIVNEKNPNAVTFDFGDVDIDDAKTPPNGVGAIKLMMFGNINNRSKLLMQLNEPIKYTLHTDGKTVLIKIAKEAQVEEKPKSVNQDNKAVIEPQVQKEATKSEGAPAVDASVEVVPLVNDEQLQAKSVDPVLTDEEKLKLVR